MKRVRTLLILGGVALLFFLGINGVFSPKGHAPPVQPAFVELNPQKLEDLRQEFNATDSEVRIVLWVSPT